MSKHDKISWNLCSRCMHAFLQQFVFKSWTRITQTLSETQYRNASFFCEPISKYVYLLEIKIHLGSRVTNTCDVCATIGTFDIWCTPFQIVISSAAFWAATSPTLACLPSLMHTPSMCMQIWNITCRYSQWCLGIVFAKHVLVIASIQRDRYWNGNTCPA